MDLPNRPLPAVCQTCTEPDCWECDYAVLLWGSPEQNNPLLARKLKEKAIAHHQCQIGEIDRQLKKKQKRPDKKP